MSKGQNDQRIQGIEATMDGTKGVKIVTGFTISQTLDLSKIRLSNRISVPQAAQLLTK